MLRSAEAEVESQLRDRRIGLGQQAFGLLQAAGELKVEIQNPDGTPVLGYTLDDCFPIFGDHIDFPVSWKSKGADVSALAGQPVRLRFALKDADLYAFQFLPAR